MKRKSNLPLFILCLFAQSGCMCVQTVKHIGVHETRLYPIDFWTNSCGERVLKCQVMDIHMATSAGRDMGTRFIYAPRTTWDTVASDAAGDNYGGYDKAVNLEPTVALSTNNATPITDGFWLVPSEVKQSLVAAPPEGCTPWTPATKDNTRCSCPHYSTSIGSHPVEIIICGTQMAQSQAQYKTFWWRPAQILLIPAFVVDVVTSPIQLVIVLHNLSKIAR